MGVHRFAKNLFWSFYEKLLSSFPEEIYLILIAVVGASIQLFIQRFVISYQTQLVKKRQFSFILFWGPRFHSFASIGHLALSFPRLKIPQNFPKPYRYIFPTIALPHPSSHHSSSPYPTRHFQKHHHLSMPRWT